MFDKLKASLRRVNPAVVGAGAAALTFGSNAFAAVDTSAAVAAFTDTGTAINAVGPAMLIAVAAGIVYKWVTAFLI